jgi:hypothetical protein
VILVRDRNVPVATSADATDGPAVNGLKRWRPLKKFAAALDRPVAGPPVEVLISDDRNR